MENRPRTYETNTRASYMHPTSAQSISQRESVHAEPISGPSELPPSYDEAIRVSDTEEFPTQQHTVPGNALYQLPYTGNQINQINQTYSSPQYAYAEPSGLSAPTACRAAVGPSNYLNQGENLSAEKQFLDQALEFTHHRPPPLSAQRKLPRPIAVPQVAARMGMPFARAYSLALQDRGVSMEEFVEFIDNLNVVSTASPPLQVLDLAGGIVGMVPHHIPMIVGNAISLSAKLGTGVMSKGRSAMFLKKANTDFFAPRGLKVQLATSKALKATLGMDPDAELVSTLEDSSGMDVQQRRMRALERYVSPLTFDVPPPNEQTNSLERMSAWQVQRQLQTSENKALKDRGKAIQKIGSNDEGSKAQKEFNKEMAKIEKERSKIDKECEKDSRKGRKDAEKAVRKREKEMQKLDREVEKAYEEFENENRKEKKDVTKEDKEIEQANKVLWILIEDL